MILLMYFLYIRLISHFSIAVVCFIIIIIRAPLNIVGLILKIAYFGNGLFSRQIVLKFILAPYKIIYVLYSNTYTLCNVQLEQSTLPSWCVYVYIYSMMVMMICTLLHK
jgi:hypothetical protein